MRGVSRPGEVDVLPVLCSTCVHPQRVVGLKLAEQVLVIAVPAIPTCSGEGALVSTPPLHPSSDRVSSPSPEKITLRRKPTSVRYSQHLAVLPDYHVNGSLVQLRLGIWTLVLAKQGELRYD